MPNLYKFRSVGDEKSFHRAKTILETGKFWCSSLWEQNDPMEGVYSYDKTQVNTADLVDVFSQKNGYRICSFSGRPALARPTMWGHYANGFRGVAIEVKVGKDKARKVEYRNTGAEWLKRAPGASDDDDLRRALTTKLKPWSPENEFRYLAISADFSDPKDTSCVIGKITGVYFGGPYQNVNNATQVYESSEHLKIYQGFRSQLVEIAMKKFYTCYSTGITNGKVTWTQFS